MEPVRLRAHLTRRARGLPLWFSLAVNGLDRYREAIAVAVGRARETAEIIRSEEHLELIREPDLGIVLFRRIGWKHEDYDAWARTLHDDQVAFIPPSKWESETVGRFAFCTRTPAPTWCARCSTGPGRRVGPVQTGPGDGTSGGATIKVSREGGSGMPVPLRIASVAAAVLCLTLASCSEGEKKPAASDLGGDEGGQLTDEDLYGPALSADEVVQQAQPIMETNGAPGVVLLVRRGDEVRTVVHGFADVKAKRELTDDARMWIGSISKPIVSTAVLRLVEQGELTLDDPVEKWLPGLLPDGRDITVRMLLGHRSGLFNYTDVPHFDFAARRTPEDLVALSTSHPLRFRPGHDSQYSNTNYVVLGLLLEKVTGRLLATALDELVFEPTGMESTEQQETPVGEAEVHGYHHARDVTIDVPWGAWGAGMVTSTAADLDAFLAALVDGDLVHDDLLRLMEKGHPIQRVSIGYTYGLGLFVWDSRCGVAVGHSGAIPGFESEAWRTLDGKRAVVVLTNGLPSRTQGLADIGLCG